jgi:hypothetical protein
MIGSDGTRGMSNLNGDANRAVVIFGIGAIADVPPA